MEFIQVKPFQWSCLSRWYSSWSLAPCFRRPPNWGFILKMEDGRMVGWFVGCLMSEWNVARLGSMCRVLPPVMWQDSSGSSSWWCQAWRLRQHISYEMNEMCGVICHFMSFQILKKHGKLQSWQVPGRLPRFWPAKGHWGPPAGLGASTSPRSPKSYSRKLKVIKC